MRKILLIALVMITLTACSSGVSRTRVAATLAPVPSDFAGKSSSGADAVTGKEIYDLNCASCHGERGHGDGSVAAALTPAPANLVELQMTAGDDYLFWRISTGKEGTSMIPWVGVLTEDQIWQIVAFIRTLE